MKTTIHKIIWKARFNRTKKDISFELTEVDCFIKKVSHPIAKWMLDEPWVRCYGWLKRKYADIISEERLISDEFAREEINPRRLSEREWLERICFTKD